jgi:hypothetical protein
LVRARVEEWGAVVAGECERGTSVLVDGDVHGADDAACVCEEDVVGHACDVNAKPNTEPSTRLKLCALLLRHVHKCGGSESGEKGAVEGAAGGVCPWRLGGLGVRKHVLEEGGV